MIFLGCLFDREREKEILRNSRCGVSNAVNTFQWNLIDGLNDNLSSHITVVNVLPVGTFPLKYKKLVLKSENWFYNGAKNYEIGSLNLPFIKQNSRFRKVKRLLKNITTNDKEIIIYSTYLPFLKAVYKLDKTHKVTLIVTDLPEFYDLGKTGFLKKILRKINNKRIYKYLERIDGFVLLTEKMKDRLRVGERPYVVVEGICGKVPIIEDSVKNDREKNIILYTGTLHYQFGIKNLLDAFSAIEEKNYELWIAGQGDAQNEISRVSKIDGRIKFFGYVSKEKIYELQKESTVLINPRQNVGEYTKYSFPSKTMEYMASGKPIIMYKLDGIPDEYDEYIYFVEDNTIDSLKEKIKEVCSLPDEDLSKKAGLAQRFVLDNKNRTMQAKKILLVAKK